MNTNKELKNMIKKLKQYFTKTAKRYNVDVKLSILKSTDFSNTLVGINKDPNGSTYHVDKILKFYKDVIAFTDVSISEIYYEHDVIRNCNYKTKYFQDHIITKVNIDVYASFENIIMALINFNMDFQKTYEYLKIVLLHEIGHAIVFKNRYIDINISDWHGINRNIDDENKTHFKILRQFGKTYDERYDYTMYYNNMIPEEVNANNEVGLTGNDFWDYESEIYRNLYE